MIRKLMMFVAAAAFAVAWTSLHAADAKANWDQHCAKCHGKDGAGNPKMSTKNYTDAKVQADMKDDAIVKAIKDGVGKMKKGYSDKLSEPEIKDLAALVRSFKK